jgi:hypothetical protein
MAVAQIEITPRIPDSSGNGFPIFYNATPHRHLWYGFLKDVAGYWYGQFSVPQDYASGPKIIMSMAANATTGNTRLAVSSFRTANAATYDGTYTTETAQDITLPATAYLRKDVTFTITTASIAIGDDISFRLDHEGAHANDTLAVDTLMSKAVFEYTTT